MVPVESLFDFLYGHWRIERRYSDRQTGKRNDFLGNAEFATSDIKPGLLLYNETIRTELDDYSGLSHQQYRYDLSNPDNPGVYFKDGRFFHPLDLSSGICRVQHVCSADTYDGIFRSITDDEWRLRWKVTGPRKHYIVESRYLRKRTAKPGPTRS